MYLMSFHDPATQLPGDAFPRLLERAREGDAVAMEALFERFYPTVRRLVHASLSRDVRVGRPWLHSRFSTGDVVQEVFRSLLKNLASFRGRTEDAFCGYLAMVVRNRLVDAVRFHEAAQRDGRRTAGEEPEGDETPATDERLEDDPGDEEVDLFLELLATFDEREQLLLRGRLEQDVSFRALAEQLGYSSRSAAQRRFYAAQAKIAVLMRQRLGERG